MTKFLQNNYVLLARLALGICLIAISILAFSPAVIDPLVHTSDKLKHGFAFLVLGYLVDAAWPTSSFHHQKWLFLLSYGVFIEVVQYFIPYRSASLLDLLADTSGIVCYWLLIPGFKYLPLINWRWQLHTLSTSRQQN
ncbi:VanZ family protein [Zooshikella harenae]|uniref:VanZ family protein n=1 Tax=Zooshikella harenae TaxID=2827238 RepID=A0ABS5Z7L2_9GAMM|nr:VanZ family protein [Zooshikella harenae]MBU2710034.1 VanZ family protein [Zooshikella harenae]